MRALAWHGKGDIRCEAVDDPRIEHPRDAIIKVTACAICGSDLHIYGGIIPDMKSGDILGHENMGKLLRSVLRTRHSRSATGSSSLSRFPAANASFAGMAFTQGASEPIPTTTKRQSSGAIRRPVCLDIRTC